MSVKAEKIIHLLGLKPLPVEGGFYKVTYRSDEGLGASYLPDRYPGVRVFSSVIYYLLTPESFSSMHRLRTDEIFHFYLGDPVEMLQLYQDGGGRVMRIGNDLEAGFYPQVLVPKNVWQGARLVDGGEFALLGTTMSPGFEFSDFTAADKNELMNKYPRFGDMILKLLY